MADSFDVFKNKLSKGLGKLADTGKETFNKIADSSKETIERSKIRSAIHRLDEQVEEKLRELGSLAYQMYQNEQNDLSTKMDLICRELDGLHAEITQKRGELASIGEEAAIGEEAVSDNAAPENSPAMSEAEAAVKLGFEIMNDKPEITATEPPTQTTGAFEPAPSSMPHPQPIFPGSEQDK